MRKYFKMLVVLLFGLALVTPLSVSAKDTIKITGKTVIKTGSGSRTTTKYYTSKGGYGYCVTPNKNGPAKGATLTYNKTITDGTMIYLMENTGSSNSEFMTSQLAIWKYYNNYKRPASNSNWNKANAKLSAAKKNSSYNTTPSVAISPRETKLTESKGYYMSEWFTLTAKNTTSLTVKLDSAPTGSKIYGTDNKEKTTFKNGDKFYVAVPVDNIKESTTFYVQVSGTGKVTTIKRYKQSSKVQEIIIINKEDKTVNDSAKLGLTPVKRTCEVYNNKYYDKNGNETDEATYRAQCLPKCEVKDGKYYDKEGKLTDEATYRSQCLPKCQIIDGKYYDKDGNETDEVTYKLQCETIVVPDTADNNSFLYVFLGALLIGVVFVSIETINKYKLSK